MGRTATEKGPSLRRARNPRPRGLRAWPAPLRRVSTFWKEAKGAARAGTSGVTRTRVVTQAVTRVVTRRWPRPCRAWWRCSRARWRVCAKGPVHPTPKRLPVGQYECENTRNVGCFGCGIAYRRPYRGTSLIRNSAPLGPYSRIGLGPYGALKGGGCFYGARYPCRILGPAFCARQVACTKTPGFARVNLVSSF